MTKTIAIYARTGRNETTPSQSIDAQVSECTAVAKQRYGEDIHIEIYKDEGVSGQAHYKPALLSLQHDLATKPFTAVIVTNLNRVSRSTVRAVEVIYRLQQQHVDIVTVHDERRFKWDDTRANLELLFLGWEAERRSMRMKAIWARRRAAQHALTK